MDCSATTQRTSAMDRGCKAMSSASGEPSMARLVLKTMTLDFRHILEDKTAAYKPCAYTGEGGQQVIHPFLLIINNDDSTKMPTTLDDQMSSSSTKNFTGRRLLSRAQQSCGVRKVQSNLVPSMQLGNFCVGTAWVSAAGRRVERTLCSKV